MKNVLKSLTAIMIAAVFIFTIACGGSSDSSSPAGEHVYIVGTVGNATNGKIPVYWKDGTINYLSLETGYSEGNAVLIEVNSSGKIYITGSQENSSGDIIYGYWEDNVFTEITDSTTYPFCVISGLAIDATENVWIGLAGGNDNNVASYKIWKTGSGLAEFSGCTNICDMLTDNSGNVYIAGTTEGSTVFVDFFWMAPNSERIPTIWKNGTDATTLSYSSGSIYGWAGNLAMDGSGNLYALGVHEGPFSPPIYWVNKNSTWSIGTSLSAGIYSSNTIWYGDALAVDDSGTIYATVSTSANLPTGNFFFEYSEANLIYWTGASSNPAELSRLAGYNFFKQLPSNKTGAIDSMGNYYYAGIIADTADHANANEGIPVYWKNGEGPTQLELGSNNGEENSYGTALAIVIR